MILRFIGRTIACATLMCIGAVSAAPKIETPGYFLTTVGSTLADAISSGRLYTDDGNFIPLEKVSAIAFAKQVDVVFAVEKEGKIRVIVDGVTQERPVLNMTDQVSDYIDSGMGGIAVHPDFPAVKEILITYTHYNGVTPIAEGQPKYARVARLNVREEIDGTGKLSYFANAPTEDDIIIGRLQATAEFPSCNDRPLGADCGPVDEAAHSFTFVHYGPDGKIYIGTGDGAGYFKPEPHALYAQLNKHLSGKVLRVNPDGSGPEDNPFYTGSKWDNESKIFARGLRNPKSGSFDPATGKLCVGNVGWFSKEGIYCLDPGDNAGWPCIENGPAPNGYQNIVLNRDGERLASCPLDPTTYIQPDYTYAHKDVEFPNGEILPIGAVIGCSRPTSDEYPDSFKGSCVFGDYVFDTIETVRFGAGVQGNPSSSLILSGAGSPTDFATDRNGRICYAAYNVGSVDGRGVSEVRCIGYDNDGSIPQLPVPGFNSIADAINPAFLSFNASSSFHPAGAELVYSWDFGDGTTAGNFVNVDHTYSTPGKYQVTLTVTTAGTDIARTTFQLVEVPDPDFVTPIVPSVVSITYSDNDHEISSPVQFDVVVRNDVGVEGFRILANIYDTAGIEVAHLVLDDIYTVAAGETMVIPFRWAQAVGLGEHTVAIEFYAEDFVSWNLKYPNQSTFFVRNRAAADAGGTDGVTDGATAGTVDVTAGSDSADGTTAGTADGTTAGTVDGTTAGSVDGTTAGSDGDSAGDTGPGKIKTGNSSFAGCTISTSNDPTFALLLFAAIMMLLGRSGQVARVNRRRLTALQR